MAKETKTIARGMTVTQAKENALRDKPGGSSIGKYSNVAANNFAGNACGLPGAYPINTLERAKSALAYAHNASNPECIRKQVYKKYPSLDPRK